MAAQDRKERKDTMAVQERARLVSPLNFLVTNDFASTPAQRTFPGQNCHSLSLSLSLSLFLLKDGVK